MVDTPQSVFIVIIAVACLLAVRGGGELLVACGAEGGHITI
jgi:hypothetical protein